MIKFLIIGAYIGHKVYWKKAHKQRVMKWEVFFTKGV
jgi:hypothetical protein